MGLIHWFKTTSFYGKIIRDVGKLKIPSGMSSTSIGLQELAPSVHTGERRFLLTVSHRAPLGFQSMPLPLNESQLREVHALLSNALTPQQGASTPSVGPTSFS